MFSNAMSGWVCWAHRNWCYPSSCIVFVHWEGWILQMALMCWICGDLCKNVERTHAAQGRTIYSLANCRLLLRRVCEECTSVQDAQNTSICAHAEHEGEKHEYLYPTPNVRWVTIPLWRNIGCFNILGLQLKFSRKNFLNCGPLCHLLIYKVLDEVWKWTPFIKTYRIEIRS